MAEPFQIRTAPDPAGADNKVADNKFAASKFVDHKFGDHKFGDHRFADNKFADNEFGDNKIATGNDVDGNAAGKLSIETQEALKTQAILRQQRTEAERANPNVLELVGEGLYSAAYQGLQSPVLGLAQLSDRALTKDLAKTLEVMPEPQVEKFGTARWHAQQIGGALGMTAPFLATKGALNKSGLSFVARTEAAAFSSGKLLSVSNAAIVADGAAAGFAYDFLMRPVAANEGDFWSARVKHGVTGAATFGTLTAGSVGLRHVTRPFAKELLGANKRLYEAGIGATSGAPAGIANADVNSLLTTGKLATNQERLQGMYTMAMVGGTLSAMHQLPGQGKSIAERAVETSQSKLGNENLRAMLAQRALEASRASLKSESAADNLSRAIKNVIGSKANEAAGDALLRGTIKPRRALAGADVENVNVKTNVEPSLVPVLQRGTELAYEASGPQATAQSVVDFFNFARSAEGQAVKGPLLEAAQQFAKQLNEPRLEILAREAYLPVEGVEHRSIPGEMVIKPDAGKTPTPEQVDRWMGFLEIVQNSPKEVSDYALYRQDVFQWLNKNPDLHNWARQYAEQTSKSNEAGPIDFYFENGNFSRFTKAAEGKAIERPVSMQELATMKQVAKEFAEQVAEKPYEADIIANFQKVVEQNPDLPPRLLAAHLNEMIRLSGNVGSVIIAVKGDSQFTLYRPRSITERKPNGSVEYDAQGVIPEGTPKADPVAVNQIANQFAKSMTQAQSLEHSQYILADAMLHLRELGLPSKQVPEEINYVLQLNRMPYEVAVDAQGKIDLFYVVRTTENAPLASIRRTGEGQVETIVH